MKSSPLPVWGEAGRGAENRHAPDPAGQFASSYVGMGNNPVIAVDPDGRWAVGGQWYWSEAYKQAQRTVADFQKQLMESFSMEEVEREMQRLEMMDYAEKHGIGQGEGDSDLNTDGTGDGDKPGSKNTKGSESKSQGSETYRMILDVGSSDWAGYCSYIIDYATKTGFAGGIQLCVSLTNASIKYWIDHNITTEEYVSDLFFNTMGVYVPTAPAYQRAYEYVKDVYWEIESRLTDIKWWGQFYGF